MNACARQRRQVNLEHVGIMLDAIALLLLDVEHCVLERLFGLGLLLSHLSAAMRRACHLSSRRCAKP